MRLPIRQGVGLVAVVVVLVLLVGSPVGAGGLRHLVLPTAHPTDGSALPAVAPSSQTERNSTQVIGVIASIAVGLAPTFLTVDPVNGWVYTSNQVSGSVSVVNGTSLVGSVNVGQSPQGLAFDAETGTVDVANQGSDSVSVINGTQVESTVRVGSSPFSVVYDPSDHYVYVTDVGSASVGVLSGTAVIANLSGGDGPVNAAYDPADGEVYITDSYSGLETVVSGTTVIGQVDLRMTSPFDTLYDAENGLLYVLNTTVEGAKTCGLEGCTFSTGTALGTVIHGLSLAGTFAIGGGPGFATCDGINGWLYIPDGASGGVSVFNGTTPVGYIPVGALPEDAVYDPADGFVYVLDSLSSQVSVLNGTSLLSNVPVGTGPSQGVYDPVNGRIYTVNQGSSTVSVFGIVTGWAVRFTETGLAPGTLWSVTDQGVTESSTSSEIVFYEPNGTYGYSVNAVPGYSLVSPATGESVVQGVGPPVTLVFQAVAPPPPPPPPFPVLPVLYGAFAAGAVALVAWGVISVRRRRRERILRLSGGAPGARWDEYRAACGDRRRRSFPFAQ
jgi:YVTN family beta-propeller protein